MSVSVNAPKTPITKGSTGIAAATLPNICKMPGPPAPFVPAPLPNIGKSGDSPKGYSKKVKIEGNTVAIKGASFKSMGDMASKGTGGGMLSANTHGPCKFISPGSMDVKFEGKNVHLLTDMMTNNGGPSGSPPNAATMMGTVQSCGTVVYVSKGECPICHETHEDFKESPKTKASATEVAGKYNGDEGCMIGVVICNCNTEFTNKSGKMNKDFYMASKGRHVFGSKDNLYSNQKVVSRMILQNKGHAQFKQAFRTANRKRVSMYSKSPVGACAAQGALVLAIDHGCVPIAMTEKWCSPTGTAMGKPVQFYNEDGYKDHRTFKPGESVPPCETCNLLLPFLTCQEDSEEPHPCKVKDCGGC